MGTMAGGSVVGAPADGEARDEGSL
jgi:hypothetical protein